MAGTSSPEPYSAPSTDESGAARWTDRHAPAPRAALVDAYTPLVRRIAARVYARRAGIPLQYVDLIQQGMVGLLEAIDRFDPARGFRFESFAQPRIEGAMLDGLAVYSEVQQQLARRREIERLRAQSLRTDSKEAPARSAIDRLAEVAVGLALGLVLEESGQDEAVEPCVPDNAYARTELAQLRKLLSSLVQRLPPAEHRVLFRHYFQQQGFDEIAVGMGLSRGRVAQIHRAGLLALQRRLRAQGFSTEA
ncbi:sigma-70 family RNA polymerase sigma factor [Roseateles sp. DB2]|uniref:sigma-70 family RNA polymerase sigma factor n=1 Tax=Roseateles sp. DB2 TaxID=3453717 RepID=UPI003EEF077A